MNVTPHICRTKVKTTALEAVKQIYPFWPATRIGQSFIEAIEADTRAAIVRRIKLNPRVGKTLT